MIRHRTASACIAAVVAAIVLACGATAAQSSSRDSCQTLNLAVQDGSSAYDFFVAQRHGYLKKAGICKITYTIFNNIPALTTAIAQGQVDLGALAFPAVLAYDRATSGAKIQYIASSGQNLSNWYSNDPSIPVATKSDWIDTVKAWKGKKVGVPAVGGIVDLFTRYAIQQAGMTPGTDVQIVGTGAGAQAVAALNNGVVDVISGDSAVRALLEATHTGHTIIDVGNLQGPPLELNTFITGWVTTTDKLNANPTLYKDIVAALTLAHKYQSNPSSQKDLVQLLTKQVGYTPQVAALWYRYGNSLRAAAKLNPTVFTQTVNAFVQTGVITGTPPVYTDMVSPFAK
jgi:ABC-type nitrate/sulfonate/bicarbonate transport system substrate-binding protein